MAAKRQVIYYFPKHYSKTKMDSLGQLLLLDDTRSDGFCCSGIFEFAVNSEKYGFILARLVQCLDAWVDPDWGYGF